MKTKINSLRNAECGMRNENAAASGINSLRTSHFALRTSPAFTLIELLVVISIIAILATFTIHGMKTIKRKEYINKTQAEMAQLETAIDSYKATHGFYPPSNPAYNPANSATWSDAYFNPLYFELLGTTNNTTTGIYLTLDGSASIPVAALTVPGPLGVGGFINCTKPGTGDLPGHPAGCFSRRAGPELPADGPQHPRRESLALCQSRHQQSQLV
jgi:prepilin-type N-terminal cleavage/methylation domain-containing protein